MKFLKWYSAILISLSVFMCFTDWVGSSGADDVSLWAVIMFSPVVYYLWVMVKK